MPIIARTLVLSLLATAAATPAWAYIGPGAGLSLLGAFGALIVAILAAVGFLVLWPLRRMRRQKAQAAARQREAASQHSESGQREHEVGNRA